MSINFNDYRTRQEALEALSASGIRSPAQYLRDNAPRESEVQTKTINAIRQAYGADAFVWKCAAGAYSVSGIPDVICCIRGKFFAFELKRPYGLGRIMRRQKTTIAKIRRAGGVAAVISWPEEALELIRESLEQ